MDIVAAFDQKADDWDRVGDVEQDDAGGNHAVEGCIATQIQQSQDGHDNAADDMRSERNVYAKVDVAEESRKGKTAVAGKGPAEPALPCVAGD